MKRSFILICILALFAAGKVYANPVNPEKALQIAAKVFESRPATKAGTGTLSILWEGRQLEAAGTAAHTPAYYVITSSEGGFAIIAGDDNVRPVLALSYENSFQIAGMPEHVQKWMESLEVYVRTTDRQPADVAHMWDAYTETKAPILTGLTDEYMGSRTVQWNQTDPANEACPILPGETEHSVCGCLPLAVAEILVWFGYPTKGNGTPPSYIMNYNGNEVTIPGHELNTTYMWSDLQQLDEPREFYNCTGDVRANLAQLVYDCGLLVQASYSPSGTGASESNVIGPFSTYMGYSKAAHVEYKNYYAQSDWDAIIKAQVMDHPVMYCGFSTTAEGMVHSGHAYVFDGYAKYNGADVFHVNFGWGGSCNGYYFTYSQNATDYYNYNSGLCALLDFLPDPTGATQYAKKLQLDNWGVVNYHGFHTDSEIKQGESFPLYIGHVVNRGAVDYSGKWALKLEDKNGVVKATVFESDFSTLSPHYGRRYSYSSLSVDSPMAFGDKLALYYTTDEENTVWERMTYPIDGSVIGELPVMPVTFIKTNAAYSVGDHFELLLHNISCLYDATLWHVTTPSGEVVTYKQSDGGFNLASRGTYKIVAEVRSSDSSEVKEWVAASIRVD